jgi:hypothetical protein
MFAATLETKASYSTYARQTLTMAQETAKGTSKRSKKLRREVE